MTEAKPVPTEKSKPVTIWERYLGMSSPLSDALVCVSALFLSYFISISSTRFTQTAFTQTYVAPALVAIAVAINIIVWISACVRNGAKQKWFFLIFIVVFWMLPLLLVYQTDGVENVVVDNLFTWIFFVLSMYGADIFTGGFSHLIAAAQSAGIGVYSVTIIIAAVCAAVFVLFALTAKRITERNKSTPTG